MFGILFFAAVVAESLVDKINSSPGIGWKAVEYPPEILSAAKFRSRLGLRIPKGVSSRYVESPTAPDEFDARKEWPGKILPVRNQGQCGSCWAFSITEAMGDAQNIKGCGRGVMSPQDLVACDTKDEGCNGGEFETSQGWIVQYGVTTDECLPYTSGSGRRGNCPTTCHNGSAIVRYKNKEWKAIKADEIMDTILQNGPISVGFTVYIDFQFYHSGVYHHIIPIPEGGHAVIMSGWGVEDGKKYWLCQNSWGEFWGIDGYFKILRGSDECGIESSATFGYPQC
jgi:cathepsin B